MKTYYLIEVHGGVEAFARGPFLEEERDDAAKIIHRKQRENDGLFWADIDEEGGLIVGSYMARFFWEEYERITH